MKPVLHPNWGLLAALALSVAVWGLLAEGAFRLSHDGRGGLRHAVYAHTVKVVRSFERVASSV